MSLVANTLGQGLSNNPLRLRFLKWQCHVRQIAMREMEGRPSDAFTPAVYLDGQIEPMGHIITVLNKTPAYSVTAELKFMRAKTLDPAQARQTALTFLSATYYQKAAEFSDILTATFPPESPGAKTLLEAKNVRLVFEAYSQRFDLVCAVSQLAPSNALYEATMAHNILFNPELHPQALVIGFEPDWDKSEEVRPT